MARSPGLPALFQEWQAGQATSFPPAELLLAGVTPVSGLQVQAVAFALTRKPAPPPPHSLTLRDRLSEADLDRLRAAAGSEPQLDPSRFTAADRSFFERYALTRLHHFSAGRPVTADEPVTTGYELAGLTHFDDRLQGPLPLTFDWAALTGWLQIRLAQPPGADHEAVIRCIYKFVAEAPAAALREVALALAGGPLEWGPLLGYWRQRQTDLFDPGRRGLTPGRFAHLSWEDVLALGFGSPLVLHHLRLNYQDLFTRPALSDSPYWSDLVPLLTAGAGTLRRLDYPAFTLTCRPGVSRVSRDTFLQLADLARTVHDWHADLARQPMAALLALIAEQSREVHDCHLPDHTLAQVAQALEAHAVAYVRLKTDVLAGQLATSPFRLRRRHIRRFLASPQAVEPPASLIELLPLHGLDLLLEGLLHALLDHLPAQWIIDSRSSINLKEPFIAALRQLALAYHYQPLPLPLWHPPSEADLERADDIADALVQRFVHAPLEMAQALRLPPNQALPRLNGGQVTGWERRYRHVMRQAAGSDRLAVVETAASPITYSCRPISKLAALDRGQLGGDCSSDTVPLRALSPHHVYYGLFVDDVQQRGYMTVYEAWAETAEGQRLPVLCLETINVPLEPLRAAQQDLLRLFEAVARSRGLPGGLVLIMGLGTWNYANGELLGRSRRYRQGSGVWLHPADPVQWRLYQRLAAEAGYYNAFGKPAGGYAPDRFRLLAPFDPALDVVQPENQAEADRLAALPPRRLIPTSRGEQQSSGFISAWPEQF